LASDPPIANLPVADAPGEVGESRQRLLHVRARRDLRVAHRAADRDRVAAHADRLHRRNARDVDERRRLREAQAHRRQKALAAREILRFTVRRERLDRCIGLLGPLVIECVHVEVLRP
jgi:hypothetical protein